MADQLKNRHMYSLKYLSILQYNIAHAQSD